MTEHPSRLRPHYAHILLNHTRNISESRAWEFSLRQSIWLWRDVPCRFLHVQTVTKKNSRNLHIFAAVSQLQDIFLVGGQMNENHMLLKAFPWRVQLEVLEMIDQMFLITQLCLLVRERRCEVSSSYLITASFEYITISWRWCCQSCHYLVRAILHFWKRARHWTSFLLS